MGGGWQCADSSAAMITMWPNALVSYAEPFWSFERDMKFDYHGCNAELLAGWRGSVLESLGEHTYILKS